MDATTPQKGERCSPLAGGGPPEPAAPDICAEAVRRLAHTLPVRSIVLFGSRAWGSPRPDSDLDLLLVLPGDSRLSVSVLQRAHRALFGLGTPVDLLLTNEVRAAVERRVEGSLVGRVLREGVVVHAA